jgi:hypothetical protein
MPDGRRGWSCRPRPSRTPRRWFSCVRFSFGDQQDIPLSASPLSGLDKLVRSLFHSSRNCLTIMRSADALAGSGLCEERHSSRSSFVFGSIVKFTRCSLATGLMPLASLISTFYALRTDATTDHSVKNAPFTHLSLVIPLSKDYEVETIQSGHSLNVRLSQRDDDGFQWNEAETHPHRAKGDDG